MKPLAILAAASLLTACTTATQREMRAANAALEATWKSAKAGDWAAATANAAALPAYVRTGVEARPVRNVGGAKLDLIPILAGWETNAAPALVAAAQSRNAPRVDAAVRSTLTSCTACHTAVGKPETKVFELL